MLQLNQLAEPATWSQIRGAFHRQQGAVRREPDHRAAIRMLLLWQSYPNMYRIGWHFTNVDQTKLHFRHHSPGSPTEPQRSVECGQSDARPCRFGRSRWARWFLQLVRSNLARNVDVKGLPMSVNNHPLTARQLRSIQKRQCTAVVLMLSSPSKPVSHPNI